MPNRRHAVKWTEPAVIWAKETKQLNRSGRKLTITIEMIISHTRGISRPLTR